MRTNPFEQLDGLQVGHMLRDMKERRDAQRRIEAISDQYKAIVADPRYSGVRDELNNALGEQLRLLVKEASKCKNCCPRAERIRLLDEVVHQPVQMAWYANSKSRLEEANGDG